jgi:hypothetical protein
VLSLAKSRAPIPSVNPHMPTLKANGFSLDDALQKEALRINREV